MFVSISVYDILRNDYVFTFKKKSRVLHIGLGLWLRQQPFCNRPSGPSKWALPPWDKFFSSDHRRGLGKCSVICQVYLHFHGIPIKEICPKCQIADFSSDWKVSWGLLLLFTCIWRKLQSVSNLRNFNSFSSSDLEIEWVSNTIFQCSAAYIMYVRHMLRSFSKHLH